MKATRVVEEVAKQIAEAILGNKFVGKAGVGTENMLNPYQTV